jgi:hypothetical protein
MRELQRRFDEAMLFYLRGQVLFFQEAFWLWELQDATSGLYVENAKYLRHSKYPVQGLPHYYCI